MARRIRSIKPEILDDEKTASLSHLDWRLFVSLWLLADNYGNLRGQPVQIKGSALWATADSVADVEASIKRLCVAELVKSYTVGGQRYLSIQGWGKHQLIKKRGQPLVPLPVILDSSTSSEPCTDGVRNISAQRTDAVPLDLDLERERERELRDSSESLQAQVDFVAQAIPAAMGAVLGEKPKKRKSPEIPMPEGWVPSEAHRELARTMGVDCAFEADKFRDWTAAKGRRYVDWDAGFRTWLRGAKPNQGGSVRREPARQIRSLNGDGS